MITHLSAPPAQWVRISERARSNKLFPGKNKQIINDRLTKPKKKSGDKSSVLQALALTAAGGPKAADDGDAPHIVNTAAAGRMYKTLVTGGHYSSKENKVIGRQSQPPHIPTSPQDKEGQREEEIRLSTRPP